MLTSTMISAGGLVNLFVAALYSVTENMSFKQTTVTNSVSCSLN